MLKKFLLSLGMIFFTGLGATQLMALEILEDQACCASTWGNGVFALAYVSRGQVFCVYFDGSTTFTRNC
ncbi:MAG: hypothetical protein QNK37_36105 [Acidobacteriota bacterium]|nr:hypothetical protein [Acidobacteriota bacterium]